MAARRWLRTLDAPDYRESDSVTARCLNAVLEDESPEVPLLAIADVGKADGMTQLAKETWLGLAPTHPVVTL